MRSYKKEAMDSQKAKTKELTELSDTELLAKWKTVKTANITSAVFLGIMIGVAIYSTVKNGVGFFTFFPLFFVFITVANQANSKAIEKEVKYRNLK